MSKKIKFRKDPEGVLTTKTILSKLLLIDKGNIRDMMEKVELMERIEKGPDDGDMVFSDSEYDRLKALFEGNEFPMNTRFFLTVWKDIKDYASVTIPKEPKKTDDAK